MLDRKLFMHAVDHYNKAMEIIDIMARVCCEINMNCSPETLKRQFDHILQAFLFNIAVLDKQFDSKEMDFIQRIVHHGDILDVIHEYMDAQQIEHRAYSWPRIYFLLQHANEHDYQTELAFGPDTFGTILHIAIENEMHDFLSTISIPDVLMKDAGYSITLFGYITGIMGALYATSNHRTTSEDMQEKTMGMMMPFVEHYSRIRTEAEELISSVLHSEDDSDDLDGTFFAGGKR